MKYFTPCFSHHHAGSRKNGVAMTTRDRASFMVAAGGWLGYLAFLAPTVTYAAFRFAALYAPDSLTTEPELSQQYKAFVGLSGIALAICLGVLAAAFGVWRTSVVQGVLSLALGSGTTIAALSVIPRVRFPEDHYPPAALWVMADGLPLVIAFAVATLGGWLITTGKKLDTSSST
jgi:hypothetical protein